MKPRKNRRQSKDQETICFDLLDCRDGHCVLKRICDGIRKCNGSCNSTERDKQDHQTPLPDSSLQAG